MFHSEIQINLMNLFFLTGPVTGFYDQSSIYLHEILCFGIGYHIDINYVS